MRRSPALGRSAESEGIVYVLRTGYQWKAFTQEEYGSSSAIHAHFMRCEACFFLSLWRAGLAEYDEMKGISWRWQSIDGATVITPWLMKPQPA